LITSPLDRTGAPGKETSSQFRLSPWQQWQKYYPRNWTYVLDKTGLSGDYDFTLKWAPENQDSLLMAQLGPTLEPQNIPLQVLVLPPVVKFIRAELFFSPQ
jgi:hypothetical protein